MQFFVLFDSQISNLWRFLFNVCKWMNMIISFWYLTDNFTSIDGRTNLMSTYVRFTIYPHSYEE